MTPDPLAGQSAVSEKTAEILQMHADPTGKVLDVLNSVQDTFGYVPPAAMEAIASEMGVPFSQIERMSDFFAYLSREPLGSCIIDVCDGTACHVRGASRLLSEFEKKLGISAGETTEDGRFTLRTVDCVGACGMAPVVVANGEAFGRVKVTQVADVAKAVESFAGTGNSVSDVNAVENSSDASIAREGSLSREPDVAACATDPHCASEIVLALSELRERGANSLFPDRPRVTVGMGTCGRAAGAKSVFDALSRELGHRAYVVEVGCKGLCSYEPLVEVTFPGKGTWRFGPVDCSVAEKIAAFVVGAVDAQEVAAFAVDSHVLDMQERRVMSNCGTLDPRSIEEYAASGGFDALFSVLEHADSQAVISEMEASGLRGRGGAGFPTGTKWRACAESGDPVRYFIANADEGDPGAYMDRGLLESDPYRVIEGLVIGSYAIGAHKAYVFVRAEYTLAVDTLTNALARMREVGLLGSNIAGSGYTLDIEVVRSAGAFVCGESTAMVRVLENGPIKPRKKPPHLTERGLWGHPTCLNNVETLANVALIAKYGSQWFRSIGTFESPGTKVFSIAGSQVRAGLVEIPLGMTLTDVLYGVVDATNPKAIQIGGPSGGILPADREDLEMSFEGLTEAGAMMGSGGFVVLGQGQCVVETARYLASFAARQSCGQCRACGECTQACADILYTFTQGKGSREDLEQLARLADQLRRGSLCGLGKSAANPILTSLRYFEEEYCAHMEGHCPGLACNELVSYVIEPSKCQGERCCLNTCPGNAIKGPFGKPGRIVSRLCQKCGMCVVYCPYGAVKKVSPAV